MKNIKRIFATGLIIPILMQDYSVFGYAAAPTVQTAPAAPSTGGAKEPLIEVSVDSLEITESNSNVLGVLWGQQGAATNGVPALDANHLNFLETTPTPAIFKAGTFNREGLFAQLQALIQKNQLRVLANPTLMTKSGFEATFLVGGEIPYPTPAPVGQAPGVDFKKYGVSLKILPQVTPRTTIEAQINVSVSNPDTSVAISIGGTTVPGLSSREATSKVEVNDGETVVLAGIKQSRRSTVVTRVPILGSIPLLGLLFRHKDEEVTQTSLVFFVTFRLVKNS
jgi:type II secretory pathway component GspD/PulD (secretin)